MNALEKYFAKRVLIEKLAASYPGVPKAPATPKIGGGMPGPLKMPTVGDVRQRVMAKRSAVPGLPKTKPVGVPGLPGRRGGPPTAATIPPPSLGKTSNPGSFMPKKREAPLTLTPR